MDLKFNVDKLNSMKTKCEDAGNDLDTLSAELSDNLEQLKEDWNTPAGTKFFSELQDDWTEQVEQYKKFTTAIKELLEDAIKEYTPIETAANNLKIR